MIKCGLYTELHYACSDVLCNENTVVTTDSEKNTLNNLSVFGALSTGSGFSQEEEKFSVMNVRYMSKDKFASCEKVTAEVMKSYAQEEMVKAILDFSKSGGFNRRADIAVLAFQSPAQQFHEKAYKIIAKKSPSTPLTKFLSNRRNRYLKQIQRKKLFPNPKKLKLKRNATDSNYGENVERPDVPVQIYDNLMENHLSKLKVQNSYDLESETRGQASSERWRYERSLRLSSSFFKEIACRKKSTPCSKLVMRIVYGTDFCNAAMKYGLANEEIARSSMRGIIQLK
ncbi:yqaJ domain-containing protein [Trichonephila clavipes]|nr:yqaJ domain-containing protein [Trichonephila clavipes]